MSLASRLAGEVLRGNPDDPDPGPYHMPNVFPPYRQP